MANRKLTVEVDAETSKAERKLRGLASIVSGQVSGASGQVSGASTDPSVPTTNPSVPTTDSSARASKAADDLSRSLGSLKESTGGVNRQMLSVTRAFAGMATGLAMSYASRYFAEGSAGSTAMDYGGAVLTGAGSGAMAGATIGPVGAVVGAVAGGAAGAAKTYLDKSGEMESRLKDFEQAEKIYESISKWQTKLRELSEQMNTGEIEAILANLRNSEAQFKAKTAEAIRGERYEEAATYQRNLGDVRQRQQQLEALLRQAEKVKPETAPRDPIPSAVDALSRVGGSFAGSQDTGMRDLQRINERQATMLERIEANTAKLGGGKGVF